jgi:surface antigen
MNKCLPLLGFLSMGLLVSCAELNNSDVGTLTGGVIGGLVGSQFGGGTGQVAAAAGGALVGAMIGDRIGQTMDKVDRMEMQKALETTKSGQAVTWKNPDSGTRYVVRPTKTYYREKQPCREYTTTAIIDGKKEVIHGRACRDQYGHWQTVS